MPPTQIPKMDRSRGFRGSLLWLAFPSAGFFGVIISGCTAKGQPYKINPPGSVIIPIGNSFWIALGIAAGILIIVTILLLITLFRSYPGNPKPALVLSSDRRALTWAVIVGAGIPFAVFIIAFVLGFSSKNVIAANESAPMGSLTVEVIGHQWWWEVRYPADGFTTANEIHIPVGKTVVFKLTSVDVVHSFWVPQLHPKQDMLPRQTTAISLRADQPGIYQGECAEYCGIQHAHMDFIVIAQSQTDYDKWMTQQKQLAPDPPVGSLEKKGEQAFLGSSCVYCHTIKGTNASGTLGPDLTHFASRATIGAGARPNNTDNLAGWIINSQAIKPGNKMPPMNLDSDQLQAILIYMASLK